MLDRFLKFMGYKTVTGRWDWSEIRVDAGVVFIVGAGIAAWVLIKH